MEDSRVHPIHKQSPADQSTAKPLLPPSETTLVVQFPKDQILRYPPPENAKKYKHLTRRKTNTRRRCCLVCLCLVLAAVVAAAVSAGVMFLVFRFKSPKYQVQKLSIGGLNLTSAAAISPSFDVAVRAENPNKKVGIYYGNGGDVSVMYGGVKLADGVTPVFYQGRRNVTVFERKLVGSDVVLGGNVRASLTDAVRRRSVPFVVRVKAPVKIEIGSVKTWEITVKLRCYVAVDSLDSKARIVSNHCDYSVRLW